MVKHELLKIIFTSFLSHHDTKIAGLALTSFLKYKPPSVIPYANSIQEILTKNSLREALLRFGASIQGGEVDASHREKLIPVVCRIIFGRLSARVKGGKSSKDSPAAKRAAILSFLSAMCQTEEELFPFLYLMTRSFVPPTMQLRPVEDYSSDDRLEVANALMSIRDEHLLTLPSTIHGGFLNLLGAVITQLGFRVSFFVPRYMSIIVAISNLAQVKRGTDEKEDGESPIDDDDFEEQKASRTRYGPIRTLCCNRLSDLFGQFAESVDFEPFVDLFWTPLQNSIEFLPEMAATSENVPALLLLLRTISSHSQLFYFLSRNEAAVTAVIQCISATTTKGVITTVLAFVENLLRGGTASGGDGVPIGKEIIYKHIPLIMEKLALRLRCGPTQRGPPVNPIARNQMKSQVTWRQELDILYKTSELITDGEAMQWDDSSDVLESMCTLLVPFLEVRRMTSEADKLNVLGILKVLVPRISSSAALSTFLSLSKVLAPSKARQGISSLQVRQSVAAVIEATSERVSHLKQVAQKLVKLSAVHSKRIDEMDYEAIIPELNDLGRSGNEAGWLSLCGTNSPTLLAPIISTCFHFLYGDDGIVSRGAFHAIKALVSAAAAKTLASIDPAQEDSDSWTKTIESSVIPMARAGLHSRNPAIRRHFILIIAEISQSFQGQSSPQFHGDLCSLMCADNPDLDFFVNATHVQLHRRAKAFQRLRKHLNDNAHNTDECVLTQQSLSNVLLPLAMHPAYESQTKADELFALEAIATVGAISRFLSWSKYSSTLWTTLTQLDRHPDQERYLIGMICTIIDGFHFEVTELNSKDSNEVGEEDDGSDDELQQGSAVWRALHRRIIPRTEGLLLKEKTDKRGTRTKNLRPTIALAMLKLFQKLPTKFFEARLPRLLGVICDALKNKDSGAREIARKTMAKMVVSMDLKYLADVIRELAITLTEGFYLHVRSAVVHSILQELAEVYKPSPPSSNLDTSTPSFDKCTAAFMGLIQEDLFGEARERRESKDTQVRFVKEASGTKSVHSVEMLCRLITFKPSHASNGREGTSSIHFVLLPLLERLRVATVDMSTIKKIKEILGRIVIGLSHNPSVTPDESLPFVYATVRPFVGVDPLEMIRQGNADDGNSDGDDDDAGQSSLSPIKISGGAASKSTGPFQGSSRGVVVEWRPSTLKAATTSKAAREGNKAEKRELARVQDGASAPKLTGSYRYAPVKISSAFGLDDPASISAVVFGLNLLSAFMKHTELGEGDQFVSMMDPFLPLLTACVCHCRDTDVALMSLKCLVALLRFHLPSLSICAKSLGVQTLKLLTTLGASSHQNNDLTQACFKTLTYLISLDAGQSGQDEMGSSSVRRTVAGGEEALAKGSKMPLDSGQMQILINLLKLSIAESEQHNPAYGLIKAIVSRRYVSPEFYDLMETMLKMSVRSQKSSVRQVRGIIMKYRNSGAICNVSPLLEFLPTTAKHGYFHSILA
jgi:U3 small nucleolar RNA-associated protein 20